MWKIVWFEYGEQKEMKINKNALIDLETELLTLEDIGINTNQVKVYSPEGNKLNYVEALEYCITALQNQSGR